MSTMAVVCGLDGAPAPYLIADIPPQLPRLYRHVFSLLFVVILEFTITQ